MPFLVSKLRALSDFVSNSVIVLRKLSPTALFVRRLFSRLAQEMIVFAIVEARVNALLLRESDFVSHDTALSDFNS